jgi:hypothetical protein
VANVHFVITRDLSHPADVVFEELIDWKGHAAWVPLTRVRVLTGDGGQGTEFVATTGIGPVALPDRMRVDALDRAGKTARVMKIGPLLTGPVHLSVSSTGEDTSRLEWVEDIRVPGVPQVLSKPLAAAACRAFQMSITRLAALLAGNRPRAGSARNRGGSRG